MIVWHGHLARGIPGHGLEAGATVFVWHGHLARGIPGHGLEGRATVFVWHGHLARGIPGHGLEAGATVLCGTGILPVGFRDTGWKPVPLYWDIPGVREPTADRAGLAVFAVS
jgi:hypothetical protein